MLAESLTKLTRKNSLFEWGDDQLHTFKVLKDHEAVGTGGGSLVVCGVLGGRQQPMVSH